MSKEDLLYRVNEKIKDTQSEVNYYSDLGDRHSRKGLCRLLGKSPISEEAYGRANSAKIRLSKLYDERDKISAMK